MRPGTEWLETDGLGGFASGPVIGPRTRRYHALLLVATRPPLGRLAMVNGFDAWIETPHGRFDLTSQRYLPDVTHPAHHGRQVGFAHEPWPRWTFRLGTGLEITQELVVPHGKPAVAIRWTTRGRRGPAKLHVRPFLSLRGMHAMAHEDDGFRFDATVTRSRVEWTPCVDRPGVLSVANADYAHDPEWYRNFQYDDERARGLDYTEDLASPGVLTFDLAAGEASWILAPRLPDTDAFVDDDVTATVLATRIFAAEKRRRAAFPTPLHRAADQYLVRRGNGTSIIAGYPWFSDWGRDTFIALRGLCLATGRLDVAADILLGWANVISDGMLPNNFADAGGVPQYNSVDASLWYVIAVYDFLRAGERRRQILPDADRSALEHAVDAILTGYNRGTRYGIRADTDGLLAAGEPGVQLTWMDARVGARVITPRVGKPVEVQALWINALRIGSTFDDAWRPAYERAFAAFGERFWNPDRECLYDVIDVDHVPGRVDASLRPNQILAVGGLPFRALGGTRAGERARAIVDIVEETLWTPLGLRTLAPGEPNYTARYGGGVSERDAAYHQGTVWPWLAGPFIDAWLAVRGGGSEARTEARERFLTPLMRHLEDAGLGHVSEIADGDPPHTPRGCPFQAWSLGELLRVLHGPLAMRRAAQPLPNPTDEP